MTVRHWCLVLIVLLAAMPFAPGCVIGDEDEEDPAVEEEDDPPEKTYNDALDGYAAGAVAFSYLDGLWAETTIADSAMPILSLAFKGPNDGWAGGTGAVLRFDGTWSTVELSGAGSYRFTRVVPGEAAVYVLGVNSANERTVLFTYSFESGTWSEFDPAVQYGQQGAKIADIALIDGIGIVALANWDKVPYLISFSSEGPSVEEIRPADETEYAELQALGVRGNSESYTIWAGGKLVTQDKEATRAVIMRRGPSGWTYDLMVEEFDTVQRIVMTAGTGYAVAQRTYSIILRLLDDIWLQEDVPGEKGAEFAVHDISLISDEVGWAVGHATTPDEPLMLLKSAEGWLQARPPKDFLDSGLSLFAVSMFPAPESQTDDDDDDTSPDDDDDDDNDTSADDDDDDDDDTVSS
jgi:hypothetical protein